MSVWEYKVISSGKGGFASPALLEKFLGDLGREEWEIIHYQTPPDNALAFSGLARRPTQRDWTLEGAASAAAKAETDKLRAEFEAKFREVATVGGQAPERQESFLEEKIAPDDGLRKLVDTSQDADADADADEDESKVDEWDKLTAAESDDLPTFFEAIRPHMRRNQRGPGMSVGVDYLARKWDQSDEDLKGALLECGFVIPEDEDSKPEYLEYDGDLYWLNENRRGELWINTKEKPRPVFRPVKGEKVVVEEEPKPERAKGGDRSQPTEGRKPERGAKAETQGRGKEDAAAAGESPAAEPAATRRPQAEAVAGTPLPEGPALLEKIRPLMRRNRREPGGSGSASFLSRGLKCSEEDLKTAFAGLGLVVPTAASDKPVYVELDDQLWWLNLDSRGGLWINGRDREPGETAGSATEAAAVAESPSASVEFTSEPAVAATLTEAAVGAEPAGEGWLGAVRPLLQATRTSTFSAKVEGIAEERGTALDELLNHLVAAGLKLPEKPREKPVQVESAGEVFWLSRNAKGELWLNAKPASSGGTGEDSSADSSSDESDGAKKSRRPRRPKKAD